ncbi:lytic transglycosylase domain-containing protein [Buttiauxella sp. 3AFRM03]|uniref:lytic transglycosylase domain-containing protein n=1 Tax=Buttiauxella sp. 3AFRM03 TaxID=2479367 RepID=UPI000EF7DF4B|nr:transglycosylase SLT domain-containing protein [Buttiauxella sp. 3AFRM03]AYN25775.1 lytic transglycosylase domain-containing protein [Buttiauxella sp. 3AFRM03]
MIIQELAYKVTIKADEFLNGKKKVADGARELGDTVTKEWEAIGDTAKTTGGEIVKTGDEIQRSNKKTGQSLSDAGFDAKKFGTAAVSSFRGVTAAAAGFLGVGAGLYGVKQLFTSTANEIVRASQQAKFFGSDVNKMFGVQRGFKQAGLNGDAFISASGNARMALANIADPTVFGGLTGAAQNLMVLGARTSLNINNLGDPNKALGEFTSYGKKHSQENLMQVMSAAGFDPTDAAKIKSGELKSLVDSETKKSNITAAQVKKQEDLVATLGQLDSQFTRLKTDLATAFAPDVVNGMKAFGSWIENNHGNIIAFFDAAGSTAKRFTEAVGGAENALKLLAAAYVGSKVTGGAVPPWLAGLIAYGTYLHNDQENIKDSAESSLSYTKRNIGDAMRSIGIDTEYGRPEGTVLGDNIQWDIPGSTDTLLDAIRKVESSDGKNLYSPKGAVGEYQIMADTGRELGLRIDSQVDERLDPEKSRAASSSYISKMLKKYDGNLNDSLMAYNWGPGNVDQWIKQGRGDGFTDKDGNWRSLPKETREYTGKIRSALGGGGDGSSGAPDNVAYYTKQRSLTESRPYQLSSSGGSPKVTNSTHIGTVNVTSNPQTVDALTKSVNQQAQRSSTNAAVSSSVSG